MWVRIDDAILDNPKIVAVGTVGFALYVAGIVYCGRNLTDGFIPTAVLPRLLTPCADDAHFSHTIRALIAHGLLKERADGYTIHDYLQYNPSRYRVRRERASARRRMSEVRANKPRINGEVSVARTRSTTRTRTRSRSTSPDPVVKAQDLRADPAVTDLLRTYHAIPGVPKKPTKDLDIIAEQVRLYGVEHVRESLAVAAQKIGAADKPRQYFVGVCRGRWEERTTAGQPAQTLLDRADEVAEQSRQQRERRTS